MKGILAACGALALAGITASHGQQPPPGQDLEAFLTGPAERLTVQGDAAGIARLAPPLRMLHSPYGRRLYTKPDLVRQAVADDPGLRALAVSPQYGAAMRTAVERMLAYATLPGPEARGFNSFNLGDVFPFRRAAGVRHAVRRLAASNAAAGRTPDPSSAGGTLPTPAQPAAPAGAAPPASPPAGLGAFGDVRAVKPVPTPDLKAQARIALAAARESFPESLSVFVTTMPGDDHPVLWVVGKLPRRINALVPLNFTLMGQQYGLRASGADVDDAGDRSPVLLDRQQLTPAGQGAGEWFGWNYPLAEPPRGGQTDLLVSCWVSPISAFTEAIAVSRTAKGEWLCIPMTRMERFHNLNRYQAVQRTEIGQPLQTELPRRPRPAGAPAPARKAPVAP